MNCFCQFLFMLFGIVQEVGLGDQLCSKRRLRLCILLRSIMLFKLISLSLELCLVFKFRYNLYVFEIIVRRIGFSIFRTSLTTESCLRVLELDGFWGFVWLVSNV